MGTFRIEIAFIIGLSVSFWLSIHGFWKKLSPPENVHMKKITTIDNVQNVSKKNGTLECSENNLTRNFTIEFPQCVFPDSQHVSSIQNIIPKFSKYIPSNFPPRYDHQCFLMKARYNCAGELSKENGKVATDFKLVANFGQPDISANDKHNNTSNFCDFRKLIDWVGGPIGVAQALGATKEKPIHVLIQGTSYLRQVFEALVCGFQENITNLQAQLGRPQEVGDLHEEFVSILDMETIKEGGCHAVKNISLFYNRDVPVPPNKYLCSDDIAKVIFGDVIHFYYIYRSYFYNKTELVGFYDLLGVPLDIQDGSSTLDFLVYNTWDPEESMKKTYNRAPRRTMKIDFLEQLSDVQLRDLGVFFGARNPFIYHPPDVHGCMPGVPDDAANLLLYLLLVSGNLRAG